MIAPRFGPAEPWRPDPNAAIDPDEAEPEPDDDYPHGVAYVDGRLIDRGGTQLWPRT